ILNGLDEMDREILALRHFEGLSNGEAAQVLGLSKTAANNRYIRALGRLRDLLGRVPGLLDQGWGRSGRSSADGFWGGGAMGDQGDATAVQVDLAGTATGAWRPAEDRVGELAEAFLERYRRGERPAVEEYAAAHPELAGEIRRLFPALLVMEDLRPA